jgi:peptidoglycan/xylan/chitin deacetylase (PgdA/CDA1 family)
MSGSRRSIAILTYHSLDESGSVVSLSPQAFADQMGALAGLGFRGVSLGEAVAQREARGTWPERTVAITFDDGFANFHEEALPVLDRHGFTATVFLVSGHVGGRNDWAPPPPGLGERPMLSWAQVREAVEAGIEMGAHTRTHPDLRALGRAAADDEVRSSKREIEERTGRPVACFAYPYGYLEAGAVDLVRREFRAGCTTVLRRAGNDEPHLLPRVDAYYVRDRDALERAVTGRLDSYLAFRRLGRSARALLPL